MVLGDALYDRITADAENPFCCCEKRLEKSPQSLLYRGHHNFHGSTRTTRLSNFLLRHFASRKGFIDAPA